MIVSSPCNNSVFQWIYLINHTEHISLICFNAILIPLTMIANFLVIYSLIKTKQLNSGVNNMFCCLSISDFCVASICELSTLLILCIYPNGRSCALEFTIQYSSTLFCNLSGMIILSIAIDRYTQTRKTISLRFYGSRHRPLILIILSIVVAIAVMALDILGTYMTAYAWINMSIQFAELTALTVIFALYILSYRTVSRYQKRNNRVLQTPDLPRISQRRITYVRSMIITVISILTSLFVCYSPLLVIGLNTVVNGARNGDAAPRRTFANYLSFQFGYMSSLLSAVIYINRNRRCRDFILGKLGRKSVRVQAVQLKRLDGKNTKGSTKADLMRVGIKLANRLSLKDSHNRKDGGIYVLDPIQKPE